MSLAIKFGKDCNEIEGRCSIYSLAHAPFTTYSVWIALLPRVKIFGIHNVFFFCNSFFRSSAIAFHALRRMAKIKEKKSYQVLLDYKYVLVNCNI